MPTAQPTKDLSKRECPNYDQIRQVAAWVLTRPSRGTQRALTYGAFGSGVVGCVIFAEHICSNCVGKHEDSDNDCRNSALTLMATTFVAIASRRDNYGGVISTVNISDTVISGLAQQYGVEVARIDIGSV